MITDGRLKDGWTDIAAINPVQRNVCLDAVRAVQCRLPLFLMALDPSTRHLLSYIHLLYSQLQAMIVMSITGT